MPTLLSAVLQQDREDPKEKVLGTIFQSMRYVSFSFARCQQNLDAACFEPDVGTTLGQVVGGRISPGLVQVTWPWWREPLLDLEQL